MLLASPGFTLRAGWHECDPGRLLPPGARTGPGRGAPGVVAISRRGGDGLAIARAGAASEGVVDQVPLAAVALEGDRPALIGPQQGDLGLAEQGDGLGMGVAVAVAPAEAGDGQLRVDGLQPAGVGAVAAAVVGQLEDGALAEQLGA